MIFDRMRLALGLRLRRARGNASSRPDSLRARAVRTGAACLLVCAVLFLLAPQLRAASPSFVSAEVSSDGEDVVVTFSEEVFVHLMAKYVSNLVSGVGLELFIRAVMSVTIDGRTDALSRASLSGSELRLTVSTPAIHSEQEVKVAYNNVFAVNSMGFGGLLIDADGNPVPNFGYQTATNNSGLGGTVNIDAGPVISVNSLRISEGGSAEYTVALASQPSGNVTVEYPLFPTNAYLALSPDSLTFNQDDWDDPKKVTARTSRDGNSFDSWVLIVNNHGIRPNRKSSFLRVVIEDQDTPLDVSGETSINYAENGTSSVATYSVADAEDGSITWSVYGKNEQGQDANDFSISSDGVLTFKAPPDYENPTDSDRDNVYNVMIEASDGSSTGVLLDVEITVTNVSPDVSITPQALSVSEDGGSAQFTVELSAAHSDTVTVNWATADGTATGGGDYTADSGTLSFAPNETQKTISVAITDDALDEGSETFTVTLSNPSNAELAAASTSTVTITDNDTVVSITPRALPVDEGAGAAQFMVNLSAARSDTVTVQWVTSDGTAVAGEDYAAGGSTLSFAPNETQKIISVAITDDALDEGSETFTVTLSNPSNAELGAASTSTVTIADNDTVGVSVTPQILSVTEGESDTYEVVLQSQPTADVTVAVEISPSGSDVSVNKPTLTFTPTTWNMVQTVTVSVEEDTDTDSDPAVRIDHTSTGGGYGGVSAPSVSVTVVEDDTGFVSLSETAKRVGERGRVQIAVRLSAAHSDEVTVNWATADGTATEGEDYTADSGTLSFAPNETQKTISVAIAEDGVDEDDETFAVTLSDASSARLAAARATTVTITDNDTRGVAVSPQVLSVDEGASATYEVALESEPTGDVTVTIGVNPPGGDVSVGERSLEFTPNDWDEPQEVEVSAAEDEDTDPDSARLSHTPSGGGYGGVSVPAVAVTVVENDVPADDAAFVPDGLPEEADPDELRALLALYDSTGGGGWQDSINWGTSGPLDTWYGVTVDAEGRVVELDLGGNGLRGAVPVGIADLERLRRLYLDNNRLTAFPLAQFQAFVDVSDPVLEELSLWGNEGLSGLNIPDELGRRVDRAALRALYEGSGGPGWMNGDGWLSEADLFSFSAWYGVLSNDGGRVSEIDLSDNGLAGELAGALSALSALERLDLSGNAGLTGELPHGLAELPVLVMVDIDGTGACAPGDSVFQRWLSGIDFRGEICGVDAGGGGGFEQSGGGGCAVASSVWKNNELQGAAFNLLLTVCGLLLVYRGTRNSKDVWPK